MEVKNLVTMLKCMQEDQTNANNIDFSTGLQALNIFKIIFKFEALTCYVDKNHHLL